MPNMPSHDDANLILRLFELRREEKMRQARAWFGANFKFRTLEEFETACPMGSDGNTSCRMIGSYWEMVASFLNSEVLDKELFFKSGNEMLFVWVKIQSIVPAMRERYKDPTLYGELEHASQAMIEWKKSRSLEGWETWEKMVRGV